MAAVELGDEVAEIGVAAETEVMGELIVLAVKEEHGGWMAEFGGVVQIAGVCFDAEEILLKRENGV